MQFKLFLCVFVKAIVEGMTDTFLSYCSSVPLLLLHYYYFMILRPAFFFLNVIVIRIRQALL